MNNCLSIPHLFFIIITYYFYEAFVEVINNYNYEIKKKLIKIKKEDYFDN